MYPPQHLYIHLNIYYWPQHCYIDLDVYIHLDINIEIHILTSKFILYTSTFISSPQYLYIHLEIYISTSTFRYPPWYLYIHLNIHIWMSISIMMFIYWHQCLHSNLETYSHRHFDFQITVCQQHICEHTISIDPPTPYCFINHICPPI